MEHTSRLTLGAVEAPPARANGDTSGEVYVGISAVAERLGLSLRTIRFYEEVGLVTPRRSLGAARLFGEGDIRRLRLASDLRKALFNLDQVKTIMAILDGEDTGCQRSATLQALLAEHQATLARQRTEVEQAQAFVAAFRARLDDASEGRAVLVD